jgi:predicted membrane-bound spermidine synthase
LLYFLFFCSGLSGLVYQVVWVRVFGNVFGNTIYSASLVVAVFMLGLGAGSYVAGAWADRRYAMASTGPESLLRVYGYVELIIALMGLGISALLPHLDRFSALFSSYSREPSGWYVLSATSYAARAATAIVLLTPITLLMGGTLTLLIRYLVRHDLEVGGRRIALLYAVNTTGAALGCFLTDFALVPAIGLRGTQYVAVGFNALAGAGALAIADLELRNADLLKTPLRNKSALRTKSTIDNKSTIRNPQSAMTLTSIALAMSGFAAMGMEILWFRHFTILLGQLRAVFSLLLTIILIGIGAGSLVSAFLMRRTNRPAEWLMAVQGLFVVFTLIGLAAADASTIEAIVASDPAYLAAAGRAVSAAQHVESGWARTFTELWFNTRPILLEAGVPALLMGLSFPLANAIVQRAEQSVGRRAGVLYLSNTCGAVCGALVTGFLLLPTFGIQTSATALMIVAALVVLPLYVAISPPQRTRRTGGPDLKKTHLASVSSVSSVVASVIALALWLRLPTDYVNTRALGPMGSERLLTVSEGLNEIIAVTERQGHGRRLLTNGHPMSATTRLSQRYMRALAHIPLLTIEQPERVLVIGFGVGNTTHAASLHPSVSRVEVADLSRDILAHAFYFEDVNGNVLHDPRVVVYVNDGRHHLQMQRAASYDLITLEPPPVGYAGMAALYSKEFYALARTRLTPKGWMSQWLPAYQVPAETTLAMIRAFVDVFPRTVLLSGAEADLLLVGANDSRTEIDPERLAAALARAEAVQADLQRIDLGSVREIAGTFVGSSRKLAEATRDVDAVSDDRPIQEYGVRSLLNLGEAVPASVVDLSEVAAWCPACFVAGKPAPLAEGLDLYLALLNRAYSASPSETARTRALTDRAPRMIAGSFYLGDIVPDSADLHNVMGIALAEQGRIDEAIAEFREAARLEPDSARTHWHLGAALASRGARDEAIDHLRRSVQLDPRNDEARHDLAVLLGR